MRVVARRCSSSIGANGPGNWQSFKAPSKTLYKTSLFNASRNNGVTRASLSVQHSNATQFPSSVDVSSRVPLGARHDDDCAVWLLARTEYRSLSAAPFVTARYAAAAPVSQCIVRKAWLAMHFFLPRALFSKCRSRNDHNARSRECSVIGTISIDDDAHRRIQCPSPLAFIRGNSRAREKERRGTLGRNRQKADAGAEFYVWKTAALVKGE